MSSIDVETSVGQLVVERPSRSRVFSALGIDFCCGGKRSLATACRSKGLDPEAVGRQLLAAETAVESDMPDVAHMALGELCDHIESTHHAMLKTELPRLAQMLERVAVVHGDRYPHMREALGVFGPFQQELEAHMMKEERVLFPLIRGLETGAQGAADHCGGTIANPLRVMELEHEHAGDALAHLEQLTGSFTPPEDACNTFRAVLDGLRELQTDMHLHVHKENNVLFPRSLELESRLQAA